MASSQLDKRTQLRLIRLGGPGIPKDMYTRVLTAVARISVRNPENIAQAGELVRRIARVYNASTKDKNLRSHISRALHRGVVAGLLDIRGSDFTVTKRADVHKDENGKIWMKIPSLISKPSSKSTEKESRVKKGRKNPKEKSQLASSKKLALFGQPASQKRIAASQSRKTTAKSPRTPRTPVRPSRDFAVQTCFDEEESVVSGENESANGVVVDDDGNDDCERESAENESESAENESESAENESENAEEEEEDDDDDSESDD